MLFTVLATVVLILVLLWLILKFADGNQSYWPKQNVFQVGATKLGSLTDRFLFRIPFQETDFRVYRELKKEPGLKYGGTTLFRHPMLFILDLDLIRNILVKDFDHFINRRGIEFSDVKFDKMLFNMINQEWKDLRATMSPTFTTSKIKRMFGVFNESGEKMVEFLNKEIQENGAEVELRGVCGRYTMDVIASAAFGVDSQNFKDENSPFAANARRLQDNLGKVMMLKFMLMLLFPKFAKKVQLGFFNVEAINFLESVVKESIKRRKEFGEKRNDFLQLMLEAQDEQENQPDETVPVDQFDIDAQLDMRKVNKTKLTDDLLIAQCNLFFVAGFDTTESLLMWASYELAINPEIQEKLYEELRMATNGNKEDLTYDGINKLEYLDMVVSETLRKYPAALRSERKCNKDYQVPNDKFVIRKETHIIVPTYAIHRDPVLYPDPEKFDPERFTAEAKANRHPYAYLPFGLGPRACIANRFALMEGKAAVAHLILNFKMSPGKKTEIPIKMSTKGVLKPENGMWLHLDSRN